MRARDVAFIRKLCTLGLPPRSLVLALLPAIRHLVSAHSAGVFWVDAAGQMTSLYAERLLPPQALAAYHERHYGDHKEGFAAAFKTRAQASDPISWRSYSRREQESSYFRDVLKPLDSYHILYAVLSSEKRAFAQLSLYRGERDKAFSGADAEALRPLLRYLSMGLADPDAASEWPAESIVVEEQLGIVTGQGQIVSASSAWKRLIRLGALAHVSPGGAAREHAVIEEFLRQLAASAQDREASVLVVRDTAWGRFKVSAFPLNDERGRRASQIALLIRREEPKALSLVRGTGNSALSPQQREVALLLAQGRTNPEIAEQLGLSPNTASYHVKQVYAKLDVNDRDAVAQRLLNLAQTATAV